MMMRHSISYFYDFEDISGLLSEPLVFCRVPAVSMVESSADLPQQQQRQQQEPHSTVAGRGGSDAKNEIVFQVEVNETTTFFRRTPLA